MTGEVIFWMVVHEDTHGNRDLIKSNLSECEADALMARYVKDYQHKQEYYKFSYTASTRKQVMLGEKVARIKDRKTSHNADREPITQSLHRWVRQHTPRQIVARL